MLTYDDAKRLLDGARNSRNGVTLPAKRKARLFWEKDDDPKNRNILVYYWSNRHGYGGKRGSMAEQRKAADDARIAWAKDGEQNRNRVFHGRRPVATLRPNGTYMVWPGATNYYESGEVARLIFPEVVGFYGRVILPDGPRPKLRKVPKVPEPRYWPEPGPKPKKSDYIGRYAYAYDWAVKSHENAIKGRKWYEKTLAQFASLEAWYEAWYKAARIREDNNRKVEQWRESDSGTMEVWPGAVVDAEGVATRTSARAEIGRVNRIKREKEAAERKAKREAEQKMRAWQKTLKRADVKEIVAALDPDVADYLRLRSLAPNPDGTVTLMKYVRPDYSSGFSPQFKYKPGTTVEDKNFQATSQCGNGLHFAATREDCERWSGPNHSGRTKQIICNVDLKDAVLVGALADRGSNRDHYLKHGYTEEQIFGECKIKARRATVLGDGDGSNSLTVVEKSKPKRKTARASS